MGRETFIYWTGDRASRKAGQDAVVKTKDAVAVTHLMPKAYIELHTKYTHFLNQGVGCNSYWQTVPIMWSGQTWRCPADTQRASLSAQVSNELDFSRDGVDYTHVIDLYEEYNPHISTRNPPKLKIHINLSHFNEK